MYFCFGYLNLFEWNSFASLINLSHVHFKRPLHDRHSCFAFKNFSGDLKKVPCLEHKISTLVLELI